MKKIDKLLLTSFVGPFVIAFGVALFVLIMQFLWLYIDEIAGKGVSIFIMFELIAYLSVATFPMALPIAVLIASVMVVGNLAEQYELSSMKSAGVSLLRVMRSLVFAGAAVAGFSYFCANYLIPEANLKFKSRLYDIRKQKPALTLEPGIFNEDFRQFVIRIGKKAKDGETIADVLIEDQTGTGRLRFNQTLADSGEMFTTEDKHFFVMNLFRGTQYQEPNPSGATTQKQKYPFVRTSFTSWQKVWDLKEFEMNRTDEDRFKGQRSMLSMKQLEQNIDSLTREVAEGKRQLGEDLLYNLKPQSAKPRPAAENLPPTQNAAPPTNLTPPSPPQNLREQKINAEQKPKPAPKPAVAEKPKPKILPVVPAEPELPKQLLEKPLNQYPAFVETFRVEDRPKLRSEAQRHLSGQRSTLENRTSNLLNRRTEAMKAGYELYLKYSFALVCLLFIFIGAPMGAIIRKGGFGYPILVCIIFFVTFIVLSITCRKFAETYIMPPFWAAMMPCGVMVPIGIFLTRRAMNDAQIISTDRLDRALLWLRRQLEASRQRRAAAPSV